MKLDLLHEKQSLKYFLRRTIAVAQFLLREYYLL